MKYLFSIAVMALCGAALTSCSEWTEPKAVDVKYGIKEESKDYPAYLEMLNQYRNSNHTKVYGWVNLGRTTPNNQSERLTSIPDSIDVLIVNATDNIDPTVMSDLAKVREEKGMKAIVDVDYEDIKAQYNDLCVMNGIKRDNLTVEYAGKDMNDPKVKAEYEQKLAALEDPEFNSYLDENVAYSLNFIKNLSLDGVMFCFDGKSDLFLDEEELADYEAEKEFFFNKAKEWSNSNSGKIFVFMGKPQNIGDEELKGKFQQFLIRETMTAKSIGNYDLIYANVVATSGVPSDKIGVMTTFVSPDGNDVETGVLSNGDYMIEALTRWLSSHKVAAVGVKNVQFDYFTSSTNSYPYVRALIQAANTKY